ncbi:MAG TPA: hypothetical protein VMC41_01735 [Candidatus Nanoarchaeia archaeon]|nr:hypothetical protein [Candidatus Nanoarchaeia archaeon]
MKILKIICFPLLFLLDRFFFSRPGLFLILNLAVSGLSARFLFNPFNQQLLFFFIFFIVLSVVYLLANVITLIIVFSK